jgi:hypothetical protein
MLLRIMSLFNNDGCNYRLILLVILSYLSLLLYQMLMIFYVGQVEMEVTCAFYYRFNLYKYS